MTGSEDEGKPQGKIPMSKMSLKSLGFLCVLGVGGLAAQGQPKPPECPVAAIDTSAWVLTRDPDVGIEMKHRLTIGK